MVLKINYLSGIPAYRQIVDGVKEEIALGHITAMEELPSVRNMAIQLEVNPNTVARAYRELIQAGVVFSRQGMGFYVRPAEKTKLSFLHEDLKKIIINARVKNISREDLRNFMDEVITEIYQKDNGEKL